MADAAIVVETAIKGERGQHDNRTLPTNARCVCVAETTSQIQKSAGCNYLIQSNKAVLFY